jgi:hypothetical protein
VTYNKTGSADSCAAKYLYEMSMTQNRLACSLVIFQNALTKNQRIKRILTPINVNVNVDFVNIIG